MIYLSAANSTLEDFLCPQSHTIPPNTVVIVDKEQRISSGEFCTVESTHNITITATEQVSIECEYNSTTRDGRGFGFFNVSQLHIDNLHFINCGGLISSSAVKYVNLSSANEFYYYGPGQKAAFLFSHCKDLQLSTVTISSYRGYALIGVNLCGNVVLSDVVQQNRSLMIGTKCPDDFSESGSGTFLYYTDSAVSGTCHGEDNSISVEMVSEMNSNPCPYKNFYTDLMEKLPTMPISSGSSFGLTFAQHDFVIAAQLKLTFYHNVDSFVFSTTILFVNLDTHSSATLYASYQNNVGLLLSGFFLFISHVNSTQINYSPLNIDKLDIISNKFSYPINFKDFPFLNDFKNTYSVAIRNAIITNNNSSQLLYADSTLSEKSGIIFLMENISCYNNRKSSVENPVLNFVNTHNITVRSNTYISADSAGSCIRTAFSSIYLSGSNITFANGNENFGGAMQLSDYNSYLYLLEPVQVVFRNNTAGLGGTIYASDALRPGVLYSNFQECTLQLVTETAHSSTAEVNIRLEFEQENGTLPIYASVFHTLCINGQQLDTFGNDSLLVSTQLNPHIFGFTNEFYAKLSFTNGICYSRTVPPKQSDFNCTWMDKGLIASPNDTFPNPVLGSISTYPGKEFLAIYYAYFINYDYREANDTSIWKVHYRTNQVEINGVQALVQYFSVSLSDPKKLPDGESQMHLYALPRPFQTTEYNYVQLALLEILECPPGLTLLGSESSKCACVSLLIEQNITCDVNTGLITIPGGTWAGYHDGKVYFSANCLPTHCSRDLKVNLSTPNYLCINNHAGDTCGECAPGYSVVFGSEDCHKCSNAWVLTIVLFALAGILFVFFLFSLNLTVSSGTICGLVIYSNILNLSVSALLSDVDGIRPIVLRIFISILNLDLGFPLCFYDGMTVTAKSGLQFIFPVYLWLLVIGLIIACRFSIRLAHRLGHNAVPVLGTLLFFSYSKVLSNVYRILTFQTLYYQGEDSDEIEGIVIWFPDGQSFAEGSHIALIFFALLFTLLFLAPFTILLTFAFFFVRFRIVSKFHPLIDAFSGPFKEKFRFWFGVRLWVIVLLFLLYTVLQLYGPTAVYFSHSIVVMGLIVVQAFLKPFKDKLCRLLDLYYLINYWLIATTATYLSESHQVYARTAVVTTLVSLAFVVFIGILLYQFYQVTKKTRLQEIIRTKIRSLSKRHSLLKNEEVSVMEDSESSEGSAINNTTKNRVYDARRFRDSILESFN